jgi:CRISPR-associated protein Cas2
MRTTYLVCYDISNDKRLRRVFKICKNFGNHLQYSVFECDLTQSEKTDMESQLNDTIEQTADQVLFIRLGPAESRANRVINALGSPYTTFDAPCYVA